MPDAIACVRDEPDSSHHDNYWHCDLVESQPQTSAGQHGRAGLAGTGRAADRGGSPLVTYCLSRNMSLAFRFCRDGGSWPVLARFGRTKAGIHSQESKAGRSGGCRTEMPISLVWTLSEIINSPESSISPQNSPHSLVLSVTKL